MYWFRSAITLRLGENVDDVGPTEGTERSLLHVEVTGAPPGLRRLPTTVDVLAAEGGIESAEGLTDGAVLLDIQEVAGSVPHLALGLLNEERFGDSDVSGVFLDGYGRDMAGEQGVVGGSRNDSMHNKCAVNTSILFHNAKIIIK